MARFHTASSIDASPAQTAKIAIIGFGNQGAAHARNLHDGGFNVTVALRPTSTRREAALRAGLSIKPIPEGVQGADWIVLAIPDQVMTQTFVDEIAPQLTPGKTLIFLHGFAVEFGGLSIPAGVDAVLVAPKGSGASLRAEFLAGRGLASLVAVHEASGPKAWPAVLAYAKAIGAAWGQCLETTFRAETVTDQFGEQAVLCGGVPALVRAAYATLCEAGYPPELAYFECVHELKLITDIIYARGIAGMEAAISDTAAFGGAATGERLIGPELRAELKATLTRIEDGTFARDWLAEAAQDYPKLRSFRASSAANPLEEVGVLLRSHLGS